MPSGGNTVITLAKSFLFLAAVAVAPAAAAASQSDFVLVDWPVPLQYPILGFLPWPTSLLVQSVLLALVIALAFLLSRADVANWTTDILADMLSATGLLSLSPTPSTFTLGLALNGSSRSSGSTSSASSRPSSSRTTLRRQRPLNITPTSQGAFDAARKPVSSPCDYYPGLVNTGNTCFFNSVVQSLASVTPFVLHVQRLQQIAEQVDIPTPVTDALVDLITTLNTPTSRHSAIKPSALTSALSIVAESSSLRSLLMAHQQQDAHELLLLLLDALSLERKHLLAEIDEQAYIANGRGSGLAGILAKSINVRPNDDPFRHARRALRNPFDALVAQRTACLRCGYYDSIHHFTQEELGLNVPVRRWGGAVSLEDCLDEWAGIEGVEWRCWRCMLRFNLSRAQLVVAELQIGGDGHDAAARKKNKKKKKKKKKKGGNVANGDVNGHGEHVDAADGDADGHDEDASTVNGHANGHLEDPEDESATPTPTPPPAASKRLTEALHLQTSLLQALSLNQSEDDFRSQHPTFHLEHPPPPPSSGPTGTKQMLISRPPSILPIHLNRSLYTGYGAGKNNTAVDFGEYLDLQRWCLSPQGVQEDPTRGMNVLGRHEERDGWSTVGGSRMQTSGSHGAEPLTTSAGHGAESVSNHSPSILYRLDAIVVHYGAHSFGHYVSFRRCPTGQQSSSSDDIAEDVDGGMDGNGYLRPPRPSSSWLRISDDSVERCTVQEVLAQNAFLLFYRRIGDDGKEDGLYDTTTTTTTTTTISQPQTKFGLLNGSAAAAEQWRKRPRVVAAWQLSGRGHGRGATSAHL